MYGAYEAASVLVPIGFLKFSRGMESEADMLGLEYMYKTGYDPEAFVDFFEKVETLEKQKPGTLSKVFSTHPPTDDRIKAAQTNIQKLLKEKPEYVVTTSEFNDVKGRLYAMHNKKKLADPRDANKPQLRRAPGSTTGPVDADENGKTPKSDDDERPTLKRRPSDQ
jgi:predicted Zn-dependent protease